MPPPKLVSFWPVAVSRSTTRPAVVAETAIFDPSGVIAMWSERKPGIFVRHSILPVVRSKATVSARAERET
ncbi:hypothetical protein LRS13_21255 [Svornostia abyssi]|uniref:Uncharacterized protein n=1 Tax=Svornostia abyssi TaxID=2898438 RepID=A0ABY5PFI6_9ACTN|nr:hypothetical protein LRS13_21255 [Parviterribacteraceae bacterium J379]